MKPKRTRRAAAKPVSGRAKGLKSPPRRAPTQSKLGRPAKSAGLGLDIDWKARWLKVTLRVELPFWLLVDNTSLPIEVGGHTFTVSVQCETFELHAGEVSDSKRYVLYSGPKRPLDELSQKIQTLRQTRPEIPLEWRKCKTVVRIESRCNADVWRKRPRKGAPFRASVIAYVHELCRAHIPVLNQLIQKYRLATYDLFAFEVSAWDVPTWHIERGRELVHCTLVPYRFWDHVPVILAPDGTEHFYRITDPGKLRRGLAFEPTAGELELLDAMNFIQRGNYSDAVRRGMKAVPICSAKEDPEVYERAFATVAKELAAGELVCIFPEGRLTTDGAVGAFRPGLMRILAETPVPVVPIALSGLWGSLFSRHSGKWLRPFVHSMTERIGIAMGSAVRPDAATPELLRERVLALRARP